MTNEEALKILKNTDFCYSDLCEAVQVAIKSLEKDIKQYDGAEWIDNKCSNCGKGIEDLIYSPEWYENEKPNFCPFCGKKFKEKEEDNNEHN